MRTLVFRWLVLLLLAAAAAVVRGDTIASRSAELRLEDDHYVLDAEFDLNLNSTLEEAIQRGIPLYFIVEFDMVRPRWYWVDEAVVHTSFTTRLSYSALTRQYRLSAGGAFFQNLNSIEDVERALSRVRGRRVIERASLGKGQRYEVSVRMRLDTSQLPKPFQITALTSRDWNLQSDWVRWSFVP